jgi:phospholipase C
LLTSAARLAAGAFGASLLPPAVQRALATPFRRGSFADIRHVVLLMQENRSFDHYFGTMAGVRGFGDSSALMLSGGKSVFHQPDAENPQGYMLPFHLDTRKTGAQKIPSTSHAWSVQHEAWNHGKMDQWLPAHRKADGVKGPYTMGYHTRADIPFHFKLVESFTICDAYEKFTGVREPNISDWRRNNFGDLTSAFRFDTTAPAPSLKDTSGEASMSKRELSPLPLPGSDQDQALPVQESGRRPRL